MTWLPRYVVRFLNADTEAINNAISLAILRVLPIGVVRTLATIFGIWTAIIPLLVWVAWSAEVLGYVLASGAVSIVLCGIFSAAAAPIRPTFGPSRRASGPFQSTPKIPRSRSWRDHA